MTFQNPDDYEWVSQGSKLVFSDIRASMENGILTVKDENTGKTFAAVCDLTQRQQDILLAGGLLNYTKNGGQ